MHTFVILFLKIVDIFWYISFTEYFQLDLIWEDTSFFGQNDWLKSIHTHTHTYIRTQ